MKLPLPSILSNTLKETNSKLPSPSAINTNQINNNINSNLSNANGIENVVLKSRK